MKYFMLFTVRIILPILLFSFLSGSCGLFVPREVEPPAQGETEKVDPLFFAQILKNSESNEKFDLLDYDDLFHSQLQYVDPDNMVYNKYQVRGRQNTIMTNPQFNDINVRWEVADIDAQEPTTLRRDVPVLLNTRKYHIWGGTMTVNIIDTVAMTLDTVYEYEYFGKASIKLLYNHDKEAWTIYYWRDAPSGGLTRSFFHPAFTN